MIGNIWQIKEINSRSNGWKNRVKKFQSLELFVFFLIHFAIGTITVQAAATYYVSAERPDNSGNGLSWATAKQTIQAAVDAASAGDTVWVTNGVYDVGSTVTPGFTSTNRVCVTKAITVQSVNGAEVTVIDGGGSMRCVYLGAGTMLGFNLSNGDVSSMSGDFQNTSGGGAFLLNGAVMHSCTLSGSSAMYGGGAYVIGSTLSNCVLSSNSATYDGGGVDGFATLDNCLFVGNSAGDQGGGAYVQNKLNNCTLVGNSAVYGGGGTYVEMGGRLGNCVVWGNTSSIGNRDVEGTFMLDSLFNTCASDGVTHGQDGCITNNPLFVSTNDFRLQAGSPCINAGNNAYAPAGSDLAGNTRIIFGTVDMGAYEVQVLLSTNRGPAVGGGSLVVTNGHLGNGLDITNVTVCGSVASVTDQGSNWVQVTLGASTNFALNVTGDVVIQSTSVGETTFADVYTYELRSNMVFYADASRPDDSGDGTSWVTAKQTIQAAVDLTYDGDTVWVTNGVYDAGEMVTPGYDSTNRVCVTKAITVQSVNGADVTTIDGSGAMRCVYLRSGTMSGFTLTNGAVTNTSGAVENTSGGGALVFSGVLDECTLSGNAVSVLGGGVYCMGALNRCKVRGNMAALDGGGVYCANGAMSNCVVVGNSATNNGGGVLCNSDGMVHDCTVSGNRARSGGGVYMGNSGGTLMNCIVWGNLGSTGNDDVSRAAGSVSYVCASDDFTDRPGCITNNPLFLSEHDLHLQWASPCIDAGHTGIWTAADCDLDGCPRVAGAQVDMGCYEVPQGPERMLSFTNDKYDVSFTSKVVVTDSDSLDLTNGFTCEMWFYPSLGGETNVLFSKLPQPAGSGYGLRYAQGFGDSFIFSAWGQPDYVFGGANIDLVWHHVAVVFDTDNNVTFYVNGVSNATVAGAVPAGVGTGALQLGFMEGGGSGYNGRMDEIRFWSVERTPEQIRDNMHRHLTGRETGLMAYYRCNQVSGRALPDWSTNSNDGTLSNIAWEDSSAIIGNDQVAQLDNARAIWSAYEPVTPFAPGGLQLSGAQGMGLGRCVFAHNGKSGVVYSNLSDGYVRTSRIWYNETAPADSYAIDVSCTFDQCGGEAMKGCAATNYQLLYRADEIGDFAAVSTGTTVSATQVTFTNMAMSTGWYTVGLRSEMALIPDNGPYAGGNTVCFTNGLFGVVTNVLFSQTGTSVQPLSAGTNWFTLVMPAATDTGVVDVVFQTERNGDIPIVGAYTYNPRGRIMTVAPSSVSWTGNETVVLSGTNLCNGTLGDVTQVTLMGYDAAVQQVFGSTQIVIQAAASPAGRGTGDVVVTSTDYGVTSMTNGFAYRQETQLITFPSISDKTYGDTAFDLAATSSVSSLSVIYTSSDAGVATVSGSTVTINGAGTCELIASQPGNAFYYSAPPKTNTLTINKAVPVVNVWPTASAITYGQPLSLSVLSGGQAVMVTGVVTVCSEHFDYADGTTLGGKNGGNGWTNAWSAAYSGELKMTAPGYTYSGLDASGLAAKFGTGGLYGISEASRSLTLQSSGVVYVQCLFNAGESAIGGGTPQLRLSKSGSGWTGGLGGNDWSTYVSILDAGVNPVGVSAVSLRQLNLLVYRIDYSAGTSALWVNPDLSTFDYTHPTTSPDATASLAPEFDTLSIYFRNGASIDELNVLRCDPVSGSFAFVDGTLIPPKGTNNQSVVFTPSDTANMTEVTGSVPVVVRFFPPIIASPSVSHIQDSTAQLSAVIVSTNQSSVLRRGFIWSTVSGVSTGTLLEEEGFFGNGSYTMTADALPAGTRIYFRGWATNGCECTFTSETNFLTCPPAPIMKEMTNRDALSFQANWEPAKSAASYELDAWYDDGTYVPGYSNLVLVSVTNCRVTNLIQVATSVTVRVRAANVSGSGPWSNVKETPCKTVFCHQCQGISITMTHACTNYLQGLIYLDFEICNNQSMTNLLAPPFLISAPSNQLYYIAFPDGTAPDGYPYVDVSAQMTNQLGKNLMLPGMCATVTNIPFYFRYLQPQTMSCTLWNNQRIAIDNDDPVVSTAKSAWLMLLLGEE